MLNPVVTFGSALLAIVVPLLTLLYRVMVYLKSGNWPSVTPGTVGLSAGDWLACNAALLWSRICAGIWSLPLELVSLLLAVTLGVLAKAIVSAWHRLSA